MVPVPWRYVSSWSCDGCGLCCKGFSVVLRFEEWFRLVKRFGAEVTRVGLNKFYLARRSDGSCVFLYNYFGRWLCGLQDMKPLACKMWPFKVLKRPKYGNPNESIFNYRGRTFYVYVDPFCPNLRWGRPTAELTYKVIPEIIELSMNVREKQVYSTSRTLSQLVPPPKPRRII